MKNILKVLQDNYGNLNNLKHKINQLYGERSESNNLLMNLFSVADVINININGGIVTKTELPIIPHEVFLESFDIGFNLDGQMSAASDILNSKLEIIDNSCNKSSFVLHNYEEKILKQHKNYIKYNLHPDNIEIFLKYESKIPSAISLLTLLPIGEKFKKEFIFFKSLSGSLRLSIKRSF